MKVLFIAGWSGDTERYRAWHQAEQLWFAGVPAAVRSADDPLLIADLNDYDTFIFCRASYTPTVAAMLAVIQDRGHLALYDTDDLVFAPQLAGRIDLLYQMPPTDTALHLRQFAANRATLEQCDFAIASTTYLAEQIAQQTGKPAFVNRNCLYDDQLIYATREQPGFARALLTSPLPLEGGGWVGVEKRPNQTAADQSTDLSPISGEPGTITIGYLSGSPSHSRDFALAAPAIARVMADHPETRLLVGGYLSLPGELYQYEGTHRLRRFPFVHWRALPAIQAQVDINLAPLELDNPFALAKSELKYFEAGAVGVPTIASPTPAFSEAIRHNDNGLLAATEAEWEAAMRQLLDPTERARIGKAAFDDVYLRYSPEARAQEFLPLLHQLTARKQQQTAPQPEAGSALAYREQGAISSLIRFGLEQARLTNADLLAEYLPDYRSAALHIRDVDGTADRNVGSGTSSEANVGSRLAQLEAEATSLRHQLGEMQAHLHAVQNGRLMKLLNRLGRK